MPLQIRRGPTADRVAFTPVEGELIYDTQSKSLYIGDGTTAGGIAAAGLTASDVRDSVGSLFATGTHDYITFTYDAVGEKINTVVDLTTYDGTIQAAGFIGSLFAEDSTKLVDATAGLITGTLAETMSMDGGAILDSADGNFEVRGVTNFNVEAAGVMNIVTDSTGTGHQWIFGDDGSLTFPDGSIQTTAGGGGSSFDQDLNTTNDVTFNSVTAGTINSTFVGDVTGSVFADDSNIMVDAVDNAIFAGTGTFTSVSTFTVEANTSLRLQALAGSVNLRSSGGYIILGSGNDNVNANLFVNRLAYTGSENDGVVIRTNQSTSAEIDGLKFSRSRGTGSAQTTVTTSDVIGQIDFSAYDGSNYVQSMDIVSSVDSVASGIVTSVLNIRSVDTGGTLASRARFLADGRVLIGPAIVGDTGNGALEIYSTVNAGAASAAGQPLIIRQFFNGQDCNNITSARARGTRDVPTAVLLNDKTLELSATAFDGTNQANTAGIATFIDGAVSTGITPGRISFFTTNSAGTYAGRVTITSEGVLNALFGITGDVTGDLTGSVFADSSTMLIDGTNGSLMVGNLNVVGQTGNTPVSSASPSEWLEVSVNGNTRYIPLYT